MNIVRTAILGALALTTLASAQQATKHILSSDEVKKATPAEYFFRGQKAPVQLRNAVGFQLADPVAILLLHLEDVLFRGLDCFVYLVQASVDAPKLWLRRGRPHLLHRSPERVLIHSSIHAISFATKTAFLYIRTCPQPLLWPIFEQRPR